MKVTDLKFKQKLTFSMNFILTASLKRIKSSETQILTFLIDSAIKTQTIYS
jgi:hypothetical protein